MPKNAGWSEKAGQTAIKPALAILLGVDIILIGLSVLDSDKVKSLLRTCLIDIIITLRDGGEAEEVAKLVERIGNRIDWADIEEDVVVKIDSPIPPVVR